jgi:hypothetical protein
MLERDRGRQTGNRMLESERGRQTGEMKISRDRQTEWRLVDRTVASRKYGRW